MGKPRTGTQCIEVSTTGARCRHNAIEGISRCQFHSTPEDRAQAIAIRDAARSAAREAARNPNDTAIAMSILESTDNAKDFAKAVLTSLDFCEYIVEGLRTRTISPTILIRLMDYAEDWGKPVDKIEHVGDAAVTEIRRVVVSTRDETSSAGDPTQDLQAEDLDVPMIPVAPKRMH